MIMRICAHLRQAKSGELRCDFPWKWRRSNLFREGEKNLPAFDSVKKKIWPISTTKWNKTKHSRAQARGRVKLETAQLGISRVLIFDFARNFSRSEYSPRTVIHFHTVFFARSESFMSTKCFSMWTNILKPTKLTREARRKSSLYLLLGNNSFLFMSRKLWHGSLCERQKTWHQPVPYQWECDKISLPALRLRPPYTSHFSTSRTVIHPQNLRMFSFFSDCVWDGQSVERVSKSTLRRVYDLYCYQFLSLSLSLFMVDFLVQAWLAIFYCSIPVGVAGGYILAGQWVQANAWGDSWTWRAFFVLQGNI